MLAIQAIYNANEATNKPAQRALLNSARSITDESKRSSGRCHNLDRFGAKWTAREKKESTKPRGLILKEKTDR